MKFIKEQLKDSLLKYVQLSERVKELLKNVKPLKDYGKHDFFPVFKQSGK